MKPNDPDIQALPELLDKDPAEFTSIKNRIDGAERLAMLDRCLAASFLNAAGITYAKEKLTDEVMAEDQSGFTPSDRLHCFIGSVIDLEHAMKGSSEADHHLLLAEDVTAAAPSSTLAFAASTMASNAHILVASLAAEGVIAPRDMNLPITAGPMVTIARRFTSAAKAITEKLMNDTFSPAVLDGLMRSGSTAPA